MKRITIKVFVVCAVSLGIGRFALPETANSTPLQVSVGVGVQLGAVHHHHRRHHRRAVIIAPQINIQGGHDRDDHHEEHHDDHHDRH